MTAPERNIVEDNRVAHRIPQASIDHMNELRNAGWAYMEIRDHMKEDHSLHLSLSTVQYWTDDKYRNSKREKNRQAYHRRK